MSEKVFEISEISVQLETNRQDGIIAWVSCVLGDSLYLNNIAVRKRSDGKHVLSFPAKKYGGNNMFFYFKPATQEMYAAFERAILKSFNLQQSMISNN